MGQQKKRNLLRQKKFMQPLKTKKNHATSRDEKKSHNILGQKNYATSWDKKITKPLGTKKITQTLETKTRRGRPGR